MIIWPRLRLWLRIFCGLIFFWLWLRLWHWFRLWSGLWLIMLRPFISMLRLTISIIILRLIILVISIIKLPWWGLWNTIILLCFLVIISLFGRVLFILVLICLPPESP